MVRWVTPPKRVTSRTWGPTPPCKQALNHWENTWKKKNHSWQELLCIIMHNRHDWFARMTTWQITRRPASHKEVRLHSECQCLQALTHELPFRQKPRRGQRNLVRIAKSEHRKGLIFDCYFFWTESPFSVTLLARFLRVQKLNITMKKT